MKKKPRPKWGYGRAALRRKSFTRKETDAILQAFAIDLTDDVKSRLETELNQVARQYQLESKLIDGGPHHSERRAALQRVYKLSKEVRQCFRELHFATLKELGLSIKNAEDIQIGASLLQNRAKLKLEEEERRAISKGKKHLKEKELAFLNLIDRLGNIYRDVTGRELPAYRDKTTGKWKHPFARLVWTFLLPFEAREYDSLTRRINRILKQPT